MSDEGVQFTKQSAGRIAKVVRHVEGTPGFIHKRTPAKTYPRPCTVRMIIADEAMVADDTEYDVSPLEADGTEGTGFKARRPNGVPIADNDVGFLVKDSSNQWVFDPAIPSPLDPAAPANTVGTTAETEAAQSDTWTIGDGTLEVVQLTRMAYGDAGDEILYGYYRTFNYDAWGRLTSVSAETRVTIDTPGECPSV